jgi:Ni/Co efflux regulator RcnB
MKITVKKLVSLAFAAAVAASSIAAHAERSAFEQQIHNVKIVRTANELRKVQFDARGLPDAHSQYTHWVKFKVWAVGYTWKPGLPLPEMHALDEATGEELPFELRTAPYPYWEMTRKASAMDGLAVHVTVDTAHAVRPDEWGVEASAGATNGMEGEDKEIAVCPESIWWLSGSHGRREACCDRSETRLPIPSWTRTFQERPHDTTITAEESTSGIARWLATGSAHKTQGYYHEVTADVFSLSRAVTAASKPPRVTATELNTGETFPLELDDQGEGNIVHWTSTCRIPETRGCNLAITVDATCADQPRSWNVQVAAGAWDGKEGRYSTHRVYSPRPPTWRSRDSENELDPDTHHSDPEIPWDPTQEPFKWQPHDTRVTELTPGRDTFEMLVQGSAHRNRGTNYHHVQVDVQSDDPSVTAASRAPAMTATNLLTGEQFPFEPSFTTPGSEGKCVWRMICYIPETQEVKVKVTIDVEGADKPATWKVGAAAYAVDENKKGHPDQLYKPGVYWHSKDPRNSTAQT